MPPAPPSPDLPADPPLLDWRPVLRADVRYVPLPPQSGEQPPAPDPGVLEDHALLRRVTLGAVAGALASRLDGSRSLGEILDEVAGATAAPRERVEHSFRSLLLLNLVAGSGEEIVEGVRQVRRGRRPLPVVLAETRFECAGSGDCCQSYSYGPLAEDDLRRLSRLDISGRFLHLGREPYLVQQETSDGRYQYFLRSVGDRCVFLREDRRCGLHAAFGPEAKPRLCRDYPLNFVPTAAGLRVFNTGECSCYATTARAGSPLREEPERLERLVPPELDLQRELQHPIVYLDPFSPCDYGHFAPVQQALCDLCAAAPTAAEALLAMGRLLLGFRDAIAGCPLRPGEPDRTVAALLARSTRPTPLGPNGPGDPEAVQRGLCAITEIAGDLSREAEFHVARSDATGGSRVSFRNARQFIELVQALRLLAGDRAGLMDWPLPEEHRLIARIDADDPEVDSVMRLSFRQHVFGARMILGQRPVPALQRLAFCYLVTRVGARQQAARAGRARVTPDDFNHGHHLAQRILRQDDCARVFLKHEEQTWDVLAAAGAL